MTERTLVRQFFATTGNTPIKWLNAQRVQHARQLLETTSLPVDQVAEASGLSSPANLRRHFTAAVGVPPSSYRRTFQTPAAS
jgi:AraC family transcriptional regulator, transcriptional activator FtrA